VIRIGTVEDDGLLNGVCILELISVRQASDCFDNTNNEEAAKGLRVSADASQLVLFNDITGYEETLIQQNLSQLPLLAQQPP